MIQSIPGGHAAAMPAERGGQPAPAQVGVTGQFTGLPTKQPGMTFQADMHRAASMEATLPATPVLPGMVQLTTAPTQGVAQPVDAKDAGASSRDDASTERSGTDEALTPEQWLLAMIDQQRVEIQARGGRSLNAPVLTGSEPLMAREPEQEAAPQEVLDAALAWSPDLDPANQKPVTADPLVAMAEQSRQASRFVASTSVMSPRVNEPSAAPLDGLTSKGAAHALLDPTLEALRPAAEQVEAGDPLAATLERGQAAQTLAPDRGLKLQGPEAKWGEQMLHALRENVELQVQQKIQSATIRLDPPELGSMEILLSHESGRLNVQLTAANADVARLLQQTSDRLRQELVGQHFVQVNVQVGADGGGQQGQQRQRAALTGEELPMAARPEEQAKTPGNQRAQDVLVTV